MLELLVIAGIIVFIIDISGIVDTIKRRLWKILYGLFPYKEDWKLKPFDCSLCMMFWVGLIYLLITSTFSIFMLGYVCLLAFLTPNIQDLLLTLKDLLVKLLRLI